MDTLQLSGDFSIVVADAWRERLLGWLLDTDGRDPGEPMRLDLSAVEDFDSAGIQLLLALRRSVSTRGGQLQLLGTPEHVSNALATVGLTHLLNTHNVEATDVHA